jgi:diacylglycerol kinase family enzyme
MKINTHVENSENHGNLRCRKMAQIDNKWLAIINPMAGPLLSRRRKDLLVNRLKRELNAEVFVTQTPAQAAELIAGAKDVTCIAVFGGDGTIAEVVNNMDLNRQQLLPFFGGTGNGLAYDLVEQLD